MEIYYRYINHTKHHVPILHPDTFLAGTTTTRLSGPWINGNEKVLYTSQIYRTGYLPPDAV